MAHRLSSPLPSCAEPRLGGYISPLFVSQGREWCDFPVLPARHSCRFEEVGTRSTGSLTSQEEDQKQQEEFLRLKACYLKGKPMSKALLVEVNASKGRER